MPDKSRQSGLFNPDEKIKVSYLDDEDDVVAARYGMGDSISLKDYPGPNKEAFYIILNRYKKTGNKTLENIILQAVNGQDDALMRWYRNKH